MLPLESKAFISKLLGPQLLKVVGLSDFPSAALPYERMALDLQGVPAGLIGGELWTYHRAGSCSRRTRLAKANDLTSQSLETNGSRSQGT